jgi:hypothetical protein
MNPNEVANLLFVVLQPQIDQCQGLESIEENRREKTVDPD